MPLSWNEIRTRAIAFSKEWQDEAGTLADLYGPTTMPPILVKAYQTLDPAVDAAYSERKFDTEAERVAFLFGRYQHLTSLMPPAKTKKPRKRKDA